MNIAGQYLKGEIGFLQEVECNENKKISQIRGKLIYSQATIFPIVRLSCWVNNY